MTLQNLFVVSHTHWDREWYHSVDEFRARLIHLIDELLDDPPTPGASFLLDGQAVLLDDYLSVRPERAAELSLLLREQRLEAGPWYVLADELIPSGEALVRNLLIGLETVRRLRGTPPPVLYCPDSFGHPAMLPAIARGFGCELVVLWRGLGGARAPAADTLRWCAPDGSCIIVYHLPPDGYEFGSTLPEREPAASERWSCIHSVMSPRANTGAALLLNGADHHARQLKLRESITGLRAASAPVSVLFVSLRHAAESLVASAAGTRLPEVRGEQRDSYGYTWTLGGTLATRAHQKRANALVERLLVRDVEPWVALARSDAASRALLGAAWRTLLLSHPHDTLCGTSIDSVADAMDSRLRGAAEQSRSLQRESLHALIGHDAERARNAAPWRSTVVLRNPAPRRRGGMVELVLRAKVADVAVGPGSAARQGEVQRPEAFRVDGMRVQILERRESIELTESPRAYPDADRVIEAHAVGWIETVAGYAVETRLQRGRKLPAIQHPVVVTASSLNNGLIRVDIDATGAVTLNDVRAACMLPRLIHFERAIDVGDLYTPAIRDALPPPSFVRTRVLHRGPLRGAVALEFRIGGKRARTGGHCTVVLELDANAASLGVHVHGENRETDHRLRIVFNSGLEHAETIADAAFGPVRRTLPAVSAADEEMEHFVRTAPLHRWVARVSGNAGVVLVSDGLAEYESLENGGVAVTLVRSVGELSRHDLPERPGHAGWPAPTPGAQCLGSYEGKFAVKFLTGDMDAMLGEIDLLADDILNPITGETLRSNLLPAATAGGVELEGPGLAFSALMPSREAAWVTLRCVNVLEKEVKGEWRVAGGVHEAWRARLDETRSTQLGIANGTIAFTAGPREIVTILARL